ncbi:UPF0147 family protein [Candidatus Woesearchaeota archaeon]|nr:hypothetical protein [uncultured archaeon]MBS3167259.1 UPF0147 family protein [Candidatus Woesearchaeota archaeon]
MNEMEPILELFSRIENDLNIPKGLKTRLEDIKSALLENDDNIAMRINQALERLDDISDDSNTPDYVRIQIWNIVSILESVK